MTEYWNVIIGKHHREKARQRARGFNYTSKAMAEAVAREAIAHGLHARVMHKSMPTFAAADEHRRHINELTK